MKFAIIVLVLLPLAMGAPDKRFVLDTLTNLFHLDTLKKDLQTMLDVLGADPTEQACEQECHNLVHNALIDTGCPLLCHSFQELINHFHIVPDTTTAAATS